MYREVWYLMPTANAPLASGTAARWRTRGYRVAVLANGPAFDQPVHNADLVLREPRYRGWGNSCNHLAGQLLSCADVLVAGNDDIFPDPHRTAVLIAQEFYVRFPDGFGVMQPTGDRWMFDAAGLSVSERICYSPWFGPAFARRWNNGQGAFWPEYFHFGADVELKEAAEAAGLLLQRPDLAQFHDHWSRFGRPRPDYMETVTTACWANDEALLAKRRAAGWPGHEPLPYTSLSEAYGTK